MADLIKDILDLTLFELLICAIVGVVIAVALVSVGWLIGAIRNAIIGHIQSRNLQKVREAKRRIRKNNHDYSIDRAMYEDELRKAQSTIIATAIDRFKKNQYDEFWDLIEKAEVRVRKADELIEKMQSRQKHFIELKKEYVRLCELAGVGKETFVMQSNQINKKVHNELIGQRSNVKKLISEVKMKGERNIDFVTVFKQRQKLRQDERQHKERLEQDKKHHYQRLIQEEQQHRERMEGIEDMTDAQERTLEFMEELEEERQKRRRSK